VICNLFRAAATLKNTLSLNKCFFSGSAKWQA
jgi:hypothetical protein